MDNTIITVWLVDDHAVVRTGYRRLLEASKKIKVTAEAGSGEEFCRILAETEERPKVIVMDLSLPGMGGLEVIRRIKAHNLRSKVLVFSMHENALLAERAMQLGASGYITKSSSSDVMVNAVLQVATGKRFLGSDIAQNLALNRISGDESPFSTLSQREFEVFELLVSGKGISDIAETLFLTAKTVSNYVSQIKQKLNTSNTAELVHLAIQHGLIKPYQD
jgi:DNA-binding NarL/FixJ family response regulator